MLAIMGPSGAGKTTLLSLISQRSNQGLKVTGEVKISWNRLKQMVLATTLNLFIISELSFIKMIFWCRHWQSDVILPHLETL